MIRLILVLAFTFGGMAYAADISGVPRVVDGDTLVVGDVKIRLEGIDAPETDQICLDRNTRKWPCGAAARDHLAQHVMVVFNDPVPVENPELQAVLMALEMRDAIGALTEKRRRLGHDISFGIGIEHGFATLGTIGFEGRFDYAAIGTISNVASRLCDEAMPGQILISSRVLMPVENLVKAELVGEFAIKGIRRPMVVYNVLGKSGM